MGQESVAQVGRRFLADRDDSPIQAPVFLSPLLQKPLFDEKIPEAQLLSAQRKTSLLGGRKKLRYIVRLVVVGIPAMERGDFLILRQPAGEAFLLYEKGKPFKVGVLDRVIPEIKHDDVGEEVPPIPGKILCSGERRLEEEDARIDGGRGFGRQRFDESRFQFDGVGHGDSDSLLV